MVEGYSDHASLAAVLCDLCAKKAVNRKGRQARKAREALQSTANRGEKENTHPTRRTGSRSRNPSRRVAVFIDVKTKSGEEVSRPCQ